MYQNPNSRWYAGPGIFRNVWLYDLPDNHIVLDSLATDTKKEADGWLLQASVEATNESDSNHFEMILKNEQDEEDVFIAIHELELMKNEYSTLVCQLKSLPESDRKIFLPYLVGERTPEEIAEENCIGLESVYKRIYRVKKQMKSRMKMFMLDYSEGMKRVGRCS